MPALRWNSTCGRLSARRRWGTHRPLGVRPAAPPCWRLSAGLSGPGLPDGPCRCSQRATAAPGAPGSPRLPIRHNQAPGPNGTGRAHLVDKVFQPTRLGPGVVVDEGKELPCRMPSPVDLASAAPLPSLARTVTPLPAVRRTSDSVEFGVAVDHHDHLGGDQGSAEDRADAPERQFETFLVWAQMTTAVDGRTRR